MSRLAAPILMLIFLATVALAVGQPGARALARADAAPTSAPLPPPGPLRPTPSPTTPAATPAPLDEETLEYLIILGLQPGVEPQVFPVGSLDTTVAIQPGGATALTLGVFECCYFFRPVPARATWSITPADGAQIDPTTGLLTVDPTTPGGRVFTVRADVEDGRHVVTVEVYVYTPQAYPLAWYWREEAQLACDTGAEIVPAEPIEELIFNVDGTFSVTWFPFEVYKDYWGTYTFDLAQGTLELVVTGGNYVPPDVDGSGQFAFDSTGHLVLTDLWLGTPPTGTGPTNCGHRFAG